MIRWGILGAGKIAATVAADIEATPGNSIWAVAARDRDRALNFAGRFLIPRAYGSYEQLIADPSVDVIYIATTHGQHHEHALMCLNGGKPVLVEKAFTLTGAQAREVIDVAREKNLFCMEAMWLRFNPALNDGLRLIAEGAFGEVQSVRADFGIKIPFNAQSRLYDLSVGGGALLDLGVYSLTWPWLVLGRPASVTATAVLSPTGSDALTAVQFSYESDQVAQVMCGGNVWLDNAPTVSGDLGSLTFDHPSNPQSVVLRTEAGTKTFHFPSRDSGYGLEVAEVARCLNEGLVQSPIMPWDETLAVMDLMDEIRSQIGLLYPVT